jgi:hypothetical protein
VSEPTWPDPIRGSCLCGAIRFEVRRFVGPFELCHCSRCRKATGAAFAAMIGVRAEDFVWRSGRERVRRYEAPLLERPPPYTTFFCEVCGSPAPMAVERAPWFEVPAGLLDDDPRLRPDRHIFVECASAWYTIDDALPRLTKAELGRLRLAAAAAARDAGDGA